MAHSKQILRRTPLRLQFSLRLLLALTAAAAVLVAISVEYYRNQLAGEARQRPSRFFRAVEHGDLAETDRLLKIDPTLSEGRKRDGFYASHTPLQRSLGKKAVTDRILIENPDVNERSHTGETVLLLAVTRRMHSEVKRLIERGADANAMDNEGNTPLHAAVEGDNSGQLVKMLLDAGADPNLVSPAHQRNAWTNGKSPFHRAAETGNDAALLHMLEAGADVNGRDLEGRTALHFACAGNHPKAAVLLVEHGADLVAKDDAGRIPGGQTYGSGAYATANAWWEFISRTVEEKDPASVDEMIAAAPNVFSFRTSGTETLLHRAIRERRLDVLDYLLDRGIDPDMPGIQGQPPLHDAGWGPVPVAFARRLIEGGADVEAKDDHGQTALHAAARGHHHEVLRLLFDEGANITAVDNVGATVLDAAFLRSFFPADKAVNTLELIRGAGHQPTVLYAAATGDLDSLRELIKGNLALLDRGYTRGGMRPLHAAVLAGQSHVVEWLLAQGVEPDPPALSEWGVSSQMTPLLTAISSNLPVITMLLIENGCDVNRASRWGYPLHDAVYTRSDPEIVEALLVHGADPMLRYQDKSAVDLAKESKSKHRERYLEILEGAVEN